MTKSSVRTVFIACSMLFLTGCGAVLGAIFSDEIQAHRDGLHTTMVNTEYSDEAPDAVIVDPAFEQKAIDGVQGHADEAIMELRWTVISQDWQVDRQTDDFGNTEIVGRFRLVWIGGPLKEENVDESQPRDCFFVTYQGYEQHMGGGNYGPTRFFQAVNWHPNVWRMRCSTEEKLRLATPPHYQEEESDTSPSDEETAEVEGDSLDEETDESDGDSPEDANE